MAENHHLGSNPLFTRREMLGMCGKAALVGIAAGALSHAAERRPRIACVVTYWAAPGSHADWIITKLLDGYWWQGAHTPSRVDVVAVYIHQLQESGLGVADNAEEVVAALTPQHGPHNAPAMVQRLVREGAQMLIDPYARGWRN